MATIANLNILLSLKDNASGALNKAGRNIQQWGQSLHNVGAGLTAGITAPVIGMAVVAVKAASDLQESMSAVQQVYGSAADTVVKSSEEAARAVGLSQQEYLSTAAVLGVYGDTLGFTDSQTADFSNSLITAAADLGSFYNANTPEVLGAMQAALRGEFDPLERFGIMMNQASLEQYALEQGIWDGNGAMTAQQKILAAQGYILANTGDAAGDFARTSGGLANKQKILKAQLKDVAAKLGAVLLPAITKIVTIFSKLLDKFAQLSPKWQKWIVIIGLVVAAIGPFLLVLGTILTMLPAIGAALGVLLGPIGLVILAIGLLAAAYFGNWWGFRDAVDAVAGAISNAITWFWELDVVQSIVSSVVSAVTGFVDRIVGAFDKIGTAIFSGDWRSALAGIGDLLSAPAKAIGDFIKGIETGFAPLDALLTNVGNMFTDFGRIIQELFQGDFSGAFDVFKRMVERVPEIVKGAFNMIPWSTIGTALSTAVQALPGLITDAGTLLLDKGRQLLRGVIDGLNAAMPMVTEWLRGIPGKALAAVSPLTATLLSKGRELITGVLTGLEEKFTEVTTWLAGLPGVILAGTPNMAKTLYAHGADLIGGALGGVNSMIDYLTGRVGEIPGLAVEAVGYLGETLFAAGADLIGGALGGVNSMIGYFQSKLGEIPGMALEAVGSLGSLLYNAGADLIGGFIGGIQSMIGSVENVLVGLTGKIIGWKGPPEKDATLLWNNGQLIMGGLIGGIESQVPSLRRSLGGITTSIGGSMSAAASANVQADYSGQSAYGRSGGGFQNYGTYYEADRHWEPQNTLNSYSIARSR